MTNKQLGIFLLVTFAIAFCLQALAIRDGVHGDGGGWLGLTMWAPTVGALMASSDSRRRVFQQLKRSGWRFLPLALLVGWSFLGVQELLLAATKLGVWNSDNFRLNDSGTGIASIHHVGLVLGIGEQGFAFFALNALLSITLGSLITMLIGGVGEEIGWRGVLQPEMERRFGAIKGTVVVGLVWGFWHLPANLAGYNDDKHPVIQSMLLFPLATVAMAFAFAWLTKKSGSVWPAALAHGANNVVNSGAFIKTDNWLVDRVTSLIVFAIIGLAFCYLMTKVKGTAVAGAASQHLSSAS